MKKEQFVFEQRRYLHFDFPLSMESAWRLASNPKKVASHSFYPLISYTVILERYQREDGKKVRKRKPREIKVCAHSHAAIYSYYAQLLSQKYEERLAALDLGKCVGAFRGKSGLGSNIECAHEVFEFIRSSRPSVAYALDVKGFFDRIDHSRLKEK